MVLNIDVLGTRMKLEVLSQGHSALVVAIDYHRFGGLIAGIELVEKITQPNGLLGGLRLTDILGFTG